MFISKSKKGFKPKAPARRGVEATVTEDRSVETQPNSRNAEPAQRVREEEVSNASGSQLATAGAEPTLNTRAKRQRNGGGTGEQTNAVTATVVADTTHDEETSMRTRSGSRGARNATKPAFKISAPTVRGSSKPPAKATTAPTAEPVEPAALPTPPPSQATAGGFIRKSKRSIAPRAPTRRRGAATEASSEANQNRVEAAAAAGATTASSIFVSDQAETEDVARRLVAALGNVGSVTTTNTETPTTRTGSSSRNAVVVEPAEQDNNGTSNTEETAGPSHTRKRRATTQGASRKRKQPIIEIEDTPAPDEQPIIKKSKAKSRTASVKPATTLEIQPSIETNSNQQGTLKVNPRKRKRPSTPEDAEARRIEATEVRMDELVTDMRQGQISQREKLLRQRDTAVKARRLEKAQAQARGELQEMMGEDSRNNQPEPESTSTNQLPSASSQSIAVAAPQFRVVNGQVVSDESSRVLDRRAERVLAAEAIDTTLEVTEEDDLSRRINSRSFAKYDKPTRWSPAATALFHKGLQYFGLEFSMMACLFPGRSRRQLKAKFIREERADVDLVNALLRDRQPVPSREELEALMGKKLADPKELQEELRIQKEALEEAQRLEDQRNEERRLQRERGAEEEGRRVRSTGDNSDEDAGDGNGNDAGGNDGNDGNATEAEMQARQLGENQDEDTNQANEEDNDEEEQA